ncbi:hypothetical protein V6134_14065, partial [Klebsiella pneumoniae]
ATGRPGSFGGSEMCIRATPEAPRHSTWVRPPFAFEGKGAAGGHSATHKATAEPTRPQPVE